ncbi:possibe polysaccharide deacetylase [Microthyrium microscopicum]|uniref:Possibe polysaccharide deacetylase n=1 Tax=Microthyrium microscopicum TaxID=703497 RepID=A0A6A6UB15_9PEZI|nr:possibe polysaccharide deacetylase [Microthyrium microscopicum]
MPIVHESPLQSVDGVAVSIDATNIDPLKGTRFDFPRDLIGYGRDSFDPKWPNGAKIAVSFVINYEEGGERSLLEGDSQTESVLWEQAHVPVRIGSRDPKIESDYEYGSRVGVWRLLNLFEKHGVPVTAYAVGQALEKNPAVAKAFVDGGHEIASHGYRWIPYHNMSPEMEMQYIKRQLQSLKASTGSYPVGWFIGRCSPHTKALIHEAHQDQDTPLLYSSDAFNDDIPYWIDVPSEESSPNPKGLLMMPYSYDCNDLKFQIAPGSWSSHTAFSDYLKASFDTLYVEGIEGRPKMMTIGLHCRISGKPGRFSAIESFLKYILEKENVWITTRKDIALHWKETFPYEKKSSEKQASKQTNGNHASNGYH